MKLAAAVIIPTSIALVASAAQASSTGSMKDPTTKDSSNKDSSTKDDFGWSVSLLGTVAPISVFEKDTDHLFVGASAMPALTLSDDISDRVRLEASARWTKFTKALFDDGTDIPAARASEQPIIGTIGFSVRVHHPSTAITRVSFSIGYGNVPTDNGLLTGTVLMLGLETDLVTLRI
jgi:hypothetical protein